jgi:threonine/homoserine/homoserine lactone efflux protein
MDLTGIIVFALALLVAAVSPGPGIAAILARVLGRGPNGAVAFTAGMAIGDVVWLSCAIVGLAALAQSFYGVFVAIKWAGIVYLVYLAWRLWTAPVVAREVVQETRPENSVRLFLAGLALTMGNPKTMMFYLALLPTIIDLTRITMLGYVELVAVTLAVLALVFGGYIHLAVRARRLFTNPRAIRILNRTSGAAMAGAAVAVATR